MYRSLWKPEETVALKLTTIRLLTVAAIIGYPLGSALELGAPDHTARHFAGELLSFAAIMSAFLVLATSTYRIVSLPPDRLDEFELDLRRRAMALAYTSLTWVLVAAWLYAFLAQWLPLWLPTTPEEWRTVLLGAIIIAWLLPTAMLVWRLDPPEDPEVVAAAREEE